MKSDTREITRIAIPVSLEFVVALALNFVNQIIVGTLGATAIAAVGFANSLTFILVVTLSAIGNSVAILVSRAYGGGKLHELNNIVSIAITVSGLAGLAISLVPALWPQQLLLRTGASDSVAAVGSTYLMLTALALGPNLLSAVFAGVLRSTDHPRSPLFATTVTVFLNTSLAIVLVHGIGPFPELGVTGAGIATLLAALVKCLILFYQTFFRHHVAAWELPSKVSSWPAIVKPLIVLAVPMAITELVWTLGIFLYNVILQRLGDDVLAAAQIAVTLEGIFIVGSIGLMSATTVLVGKAIGNHAVNDVLKWIGQARRIGLYTGVLFGLLYFSTVLLLDLLFPEVSEEVRWLATLGIIINALTQWIKVQNMILGGGVLPSGGDMKGIIWGDFIGAIVVGLPTAIVLGLFTPLGLVGVMLARVLDEITKLIIFRWRSRKIDWQRVVDTQIGSNPSS